MQVRENLNAREAARQAADVQRKNAARGAPPENPHFKPPATESQAQPWPAWDRAVKVCTPPLRSGLSRGIKLTGWTTADTMQSMPVLCTYVLT